MKFLQFILLIFLSIYHVRADDLRFLVENKTEKLVKVNAMKLWHYVIPDTFFETIAPKQRTEFVFQVKPELFDLANKEGITLSVDGYDIINIIVEFPVGSVLLSAIAHDVVNKVAHSKVLSLKSDQLCNKSTNWQNIIIIKYND